MDNQIQVVLLKIIFILSFYNLHLYSPILTYFFPNHFSQRKQQLSKKKKIPTFGGVFGIFFLQRD